VIFSTKDLPESKLAVIASTDFFADYLFPARRQHKQITQGRNVICDAILLQWNLAVVTGDVTQRCSSEI
jgi:hypothetical protein